MKQRRLGAAAALAAGLGLGCAVPPAVVAECEDEVVEGDLIEFVSSGHEFESFCAAGFDAAEAHARWVAEAWGTGSPEQIRYGLFESQQHPCWPCDVDRGGCSSDRALAAIELPSRHELAHAIRGLPCHAFLEEGWAMLYGGHHRDADTEGDVLAAVAAVEGRQLPDEYYPLAARFVAFLIETRGVNGLRQICETSEPDTPGLEAAMIDVYGSTLAELVQEFEEYPAWNLARLRQDQACEAEDVVTAPGGWTHDFDCEGAEAVGKVGGELWVHRAVELTEAGIYSFEFGANADVELSVQVRGCEREGMASLYWEVGTVRPAPDQSDSLLLYDFQPGVYVVRTRMTGWTGPALQVDVSVAPP